MKMSKNIILLSVTILTLISLVAVATYSYFTASTNVNNKITTNTKMPLRPTFTVSGGGELALTVDRKFILQDNAYNGTWVYDENFQRIGKGLTVTLTGEPGTTCTYNIYYKDTSLNGSYVYSHTGSDIDFQFSLWKNSNLNIIAWNDYTIISQTSAGTTKITPMFGGNTSPFNQNKPVITIPSNSNSVTDNWIFYLVFYNQNYDQSILADKTFKGEVYIDDVACT